MSWPSFFRVLQVLLWWSCLFPNISRFLTPPAHLTSVISLFLTLSGLPDQGGLSSSSQGLSGALCFPKGRRRAVDPGDGKVAGEVSVLLPSAFLRAGDEQWTLELAKWQVRIAAYRLFTPVYICAFGKGISYMCGVTGPQKYGYPSQRWTALCLMFWPSPSPGISLSHLGGLPARSGRRAAGPPSCGSPGRATCLAGGPIAL